MRSQIRAALKFELEFGVWANYRFLRGIFFQVRCWILLATFLLSSAILNVKYKLAPRSFMR